MTLAHPGRSRHQPPSHRPWLGPRRHPVGLAVAAGLACAAASLLAGCAVTAPLAGAANEPGGMHPLIDPPIATSLTAAGGTWVSVPMGHLHDRLNTFWQLFFLPSQGTTWTDRATRLGMATNGGVLVTASGASAVVVGIRPANQLTYTAVVSSSNGTQWTPLAPVPGTATALAAGPQRLYALLDGYGGGRVVTTTPSATSWKTVVTAGALGRSAGRRCAPLVLTALAVDAASTPVVGASCGAPGATGVFVDRGGTWRAAGPAAPGRTVRTEVVSLRETGSQLSALFAVGKRSGIRLLAGSTHARTQGASTGASGWSLSAGLPLGTAGRLVALGPEGGHGAYVLSRSRGGGEHLAVTSGGSGPWTALPQPPATTEAVAFPGPGRADALAVTGSVMTDWTLASGASAWTKGATQRVDILYGSSQ